MSPRFAVNTLFFINGFLFANWACRIPNIQEDYGMDHSQLGFILLAHSIGAFIAMPVTGWLISQYGSKNITILSAIFLCIFFIVIPWSGSYFILFLPFFFMGASTGVMDVAMNAQAVDIEKSLGKPIMTFFHAMFSVGMVIGGLFGSIFIKIEWVLIPHLLLVGVLSFVIILMTKNSLLESEEEILVTKQNTVFVLPKGPVIGLGIIACCCMMGEGAMSDWSTNYMKNIMTSSDALSTFGLTAFAAAMTIGRLFGDQGRIRFGDKKMLTYGSVISIIGMIIILAKLHFIMAIVGFAIVGLGLSNIVPIVYSLSGDIKDVPPGMGIAMVTTIGYSGFMFGPPLIGFLADFSDLRIALYFILLLFVIMFFLVIKANKKPSLV